MTDGAFLGAEDLLASLDGGAALRKGRSGNGAPRDDSQDHYSNHEHPPRT
jgi:hypothetical protein